MRTWHAPPAAQARRRPVVITGSELPAALGEHSEPEPDVTVVEGDARDHLDAHPTTALLVVEVADDSQHRDRTVKQRLYADAGIPEYWILAVPDARLEVYRDPAAGAYRTVSIHQAGDSAAPLARPEAAIAVAELLPRAGAVPAFLDPGHSLHGHRQGRP